MQRLILFLIAGYLSGCVMLPEYTTQPESVPADQASFEIPTDQSSEHDNMAQHIAEQDEEPSIRVEHNIAQEKKTPTEPSPAWPSESGFATYYAASMQGRLTASGETYDPEQLTAAHRTIPLGSLVRVTNSKNGNQVIVRINDRWAGGNNRIINLSRKAAEELALTTAGTLKVQLDVESLSQLQHSSINTGVKSLPDRVAIDNALPHPRKIICQNEADILGLTGDFQRNHITACLMRSE